MKTLQYTFFLLFSCLLCTGVNAQESWQSNLVKLNTDGSLSYSPDQEGNIIPDFSRVGYHHGDKNIPDYPTTITLKPLIAGDCTPMIQEAIDKVATMQPDATGHRGTILLKSGEYKIEGNLYIKSSGIVLRGEGDGIEETRLISLSKDQKAVINIEGEGQIKEIPGSRVKITDKFIPVGSHSLTVSSAKNLKVGDRIIVFRPGTQEWIEAIKMNQIEEREGTRQWKPAEYDFHFERQITAIKGNQITIDNPIVMQLDEKFGGGEIYKYTNDGRISEIGVENIYLESRYMGEQDEEHSWIGVKINQAENCWVRGVTARYFAYACVSLEKEAKNVTVRECNSYDSKSIPTGGRRYSFNNWGQQNLFMNCISTHARHDYVTGARVCGPNVFFNCVARQSLSDIGPHHRWAMGTLYDNVTTDNQINVQDRGRMGSGHGWAGVTQVLWNCKARVVAVQNPWASGNNYCIGLQGDKVPGHFKDRPDGIWEGHNKTGLLPVSLYLAQLKARQANQK